MILKVALYSGSMETWLSQYDTLPTPPRGLHGNRLLVNQESGFKMQLPYQLPNDTRCPLLLHITNFQLGAQAGHFSELGCGSMTSCKGGRESKYLALSAS